MHIEDFDPDVGRRPQIDAPTVARLMRQMIARPHWLQDEPLAADPETFRQAESEMKLIMERQGRPIASAPWIPQPNFLLRGTPVVMDDFAD